MVSSNLWMLWGPWAQRNMNFLGRISHECRRNLTEMWTVRLLASWKVTHTITETEENVLLLERSGAEWKVMISTWQVPVPVHRPAKFSLCPVFTWAPHGIQRSCSDATESRIWPGEPDLTFCHCYGQSCVGSAWSRKEPKLYQRGCW